MKNRPFYVRLSVAIDGLKSAFQSEKSFRTQILFSLLSIVLLLILRPEPIWWALFLTANAIVIGAELINTSIEASLDLLHPEKNELVKKAKDCAAAAVMITSLGAVGILVALLCDKFY